MTLCFLNLGFYNESILTLFNIHPKMQKQSDFQCMVYFYHLKSCYGVAISSITCIPHCHEYKHFKKLSQVMLIGGWGDKMCAYSYLEQDQIEKNVIVSVCAMTLMRITHFPLRITQEG